MGIFKKKTQSVYFKPSDASVAQAFKNGSPMTKLSFFLFGLGNIVNKQVVRGLLFLIIEIAYFAYLFSFGIGALGDFITLGTAEQGQVYNEALGIYEYTTGNDSMLCLLYGVITLVLTAAAIFVGCMSGKSAYCTQFRKEKGMDIPTFRDDLRSLTEENLHAFLLAFPIFGILCFTIVPLIFMILIAFTSYDHEHQPPGNLFDWVGLANFQAMFSQGSKLAATFWPVLSWTLVWAIFATVSCYILGLLLALLINRKGTKGKGFWRFMFVLSVAVPQFVTLLSMRTIFNANGPVNVLLREFGVIGTTESIPFFTNPLYAKITIICINIWIGVPFTMLSTTGNINNFNVIFLLSGGGPDSLDYYYAGKTDLLVTWLYRLTITQKDYNLGAVIGILVFIILATVSLITYRRTGSYKDEGAFQ